MRVAEYERQAERDAKERDRALTDLMRRLALTGSKPAFSGAPTIGDFLRTVNTEEPSPSPSPSPPERVAFRPPPRLRRPAGPHRKP
jgi:hypothetical protein